MDDRYPFARFVVDAAPVIAGAVALVFFLGGTLRACHHGGFGGLVGFLVSAAIAAAAYLAVRVKIEVLRLLLDLEGTSRELLAEQRRPAASPGERGA